MRTIGSPSGEFVELDSGQLVRADALASFSSVSPPGDLEPGERWVDVELGSQILVAHEGITPVFATLVSTGRPWRGHETPRGEFRVWIKMATSTMDQLGDPDAVDRCCLRGAASRRRILAPPRTGFVLAPRALWIAARIQ